MFRTIIWKTEDRIGHLVLNQPPANIMSRIFFQELGELTGSVLPVSGIGALVVYGNGRHFSAGADHMDLIQHVSQGLPEAYPEKLPEFLIQTAESFRYIERLAIPTFAAIRGTCFGSALELALACRFRICGEGTVMGFPESSFGLMPGCGGSVKLPEIVGTAKAIELILSGRNFSAEEAYTWGLVHRVVPRKRAVEEAIMLAKRAVGSQQSAVSGQQYGCVNYDVED